MNPRIWIGSGIMASFAACRVEVFDGWVRTTFFADGSRSDFHPPLDDAQFRADAAFAGYADPWQFAYEHDIAHALTAQVVGLPHSPSVWSAAHGTGAPRPIEQWSQRVKDDEHRTVSLQRFVVLGIRDDYGVLDREFGERLPGVALALLQRCRPWIFEGGLPRGWRSSRIGHV